MLENCAKWIAEESARFGIPMVRTTDPNGTGVCMHVDLGAAGGGHWDCGPDFPIDRVIAMASGSPVSTPPASPPTAPPGGGQAPPFPGTTLVNFTSGHGTIDWQRQMAARGWNISADDDFGGQSENVAYSFQQEKGLGVDGMVGPETWAAAWNAPVT
jgi:hypothetical protein